MLLITMSAASVGAMRSCWHACWMLAFSVWRTSQPRPWSTSMQMRPSWPLAGPGLWRPSSRWPLWQCLHSVCLSVCLLSLPFSIHSPPPPTHSLHFLPFSTPLPSPFFLSIFSPPPPPTSLTETVTVSRALYAWLCCLFLSVCLCLSQFVSVSLSLSLLASLSPSLSHSVSLSLLCAFSSCWDWYCLYPLPITFLCFRMQAGRGSFKWFALKQSHIIQ